MARLLSKLRLAALKFLSLNMTIYYIKQYQAMFEHVCELIHCSVVRLWNVLFKVSTETPVQARIYQVKKADKTEAYKKKVTWLLRDLKVVDGKSSSKVSKIKVSTIINSRKHPWWRVDQVILPINFKISWYLLTFKIWKKKRNPV